MFHTPSFASVRMSSIAATFASIASSFAFGQVPLSGPLYDGGGGGPLTSGTVYHVVGTVEVPVGQTLTIAPGAILKSNWATVVVNGTLNAVGTANSPIVFTSIQDDSYGGDTNGNGPSSGAPDQWGGLYFAPTSDSSLVEHAIVAYSGIGFSPAIRCDAADVTLRNVVMRDGQHGLLRLENDARPFVEACDFQRSGAQPSIFGATFDALPRFDSNTASGLGAGNYVRVEHPAPVSDVSIVAENLLNGWLVPSAGISIPSGRTLTLHEAITVKMPYNTAIQVDGRLVTQGTQDDPVVFTLIVDDVYGGDTNNDGPSVGAPDTWYGLRFAATAGASSLENTVVRYTGVGFSAAAEIFGSSPSFTDCLFRDGRWGAVDLNGIAASPTFVRCAFQDNTNYAVQIPIASAAGFVDCLVVGSTYGQFLRIVDGTVSGSVTLGPENVLNGAIVIANQLVVPQGSSLTLKRGVVFKAENGSGATIHGAIQVQGDGANPVVFTRIEDDAFGSDTNSNGPSSASTDSWTGVTFTETATGAVHGLRVRYSGLGFAAGINAQSPTLTIANSRADDCAHDGFRVSAHSGDARGWVAHGCRDRGIALLAGDFDLRNATVYGTNGAGIANVGSYSGAVRDSISFGNSGADVAGIPAADVSWSFIASVAGQNGNQAGDPMFVNAAAGDLRLAPGSPAIEAGDPVNGGVGSNGPDAAGAPRFTDGNLDGVRRVDAGAYEFTNVRLAVTGIAKPGLPITVATSGTAGLSTLLTIGFDGQVELPPHGTLFLNVSFPWLLLPYGVVPTSAPLPIPVGLPTPLDIAFQAIVTSGPKANLSNVARVRITE